VSAICVQRFDDSLSSAIRITYRISLRSSSLWEPRYPLLRVVFVSYFDAVSSSQVSTMFEKGVKKGSRFDAASRYDRSLSGSART
jgi:hypothetical protein